MRAFIIPKGTEILSLRGNERLTEDCRFHRGKSHSKQMFFTENIVVDPCMIHNATPAARHWADKGYYGFDLQELMDGESDWHTVLVHSKYVKTDCD